MKNLIYAGVAIVLSVVAVLVVKLINDEPTYRRGVVLESARPAVVVERDARASAPAIAARAPLPAVPAMRSDNRLVIGRISSNVRKHWPRLDAMATYLSSELAAHGVSGVDVKMVDTVEEMRELFRTGQVDLVSETAFGAIELTIDGSAEMMMREWKSGVASYHTVIFARRDSGIESLDDLVGRNFVFEDRGSTSGYLVPRAFMARSGFDLVEIEDTLTRPPTGAIGYAFADDENNVVNRVVRGFADVGAISNLDWADEDEVSETDRLELVAIHETDPIIRSVMLVRSTLDPAVKSTLSRVLGQMHESEAGMDTLKEYWKVARFDHIEGPALESLLTARVLHETFSNF